MDGFKLNETISFIGADTIGNDNRFCPFDFQSESTPSVLET